MSSLLNQGVSAGQAGYGLYGQLERALHGDPKKVHFVQGNVTVVQFDATLNESHGLTTNPSAFAVEDGGMISDHIQVAPFELQLAGIKTDTPIDNPGELLRSTMVAVANAAAGPIGVLGASAALGQAQRYASLKTQSTSQSPSQACYAQLMRLGAGTPAGDSDFGPVPPTYPQLFDVVTSLKSYKSMCIRSMQIQRDASTGYAMVFQLVLTQMRIVRSQQVEVVAQAQPALSARKKKIAEGQNEAANRLAIRTNQGILVQDRDGLGRVANYVRPGSVPL